MDKSEQDVLDSFYEGNEIFSVLNKVKTSISTTLRIVLLSKNFEKDFSFINKIIDRDDLTFSLNTENDSYILWNINFNKKIEAEVIECPHCKKEFHVDEERKYELKYYLIEFKKCNLLVLVTNDKHNFDSIIGFFNYLYPIVGRVFYRAADLKFLLNKINDIQNVEVIGRECVLKRLYDDKKTIVTYKEDTVEGFFERAYKENCWIDSIEVLIKPLGIIRISRKGVILYSKPFNFSGFFQIVVNTIMNKLLVKRRDILRKRSRSEGQPEIKPIIVKFEKEYFAEEENINRLIKRLNESEKYEVGVLYSSNCLAHIEVYDYANGGGFDIYINSSNELKIIAQTQTNEVALEGVILKISDLFEGMII